ncbi:transcriptional regulator /LysR family transcriptional regulator [Novosphingobium sp. PhB165]|uniref:LysR family transcriptional regulator n=1 Tax=Novosphingobium sp. PhB165 TaxID=2485105 RepID=UPI001047C45A|nr:LysR family transcriptional regulator [Novosphingobium sp. PhB165]TCM16458.1 transcriptional regulator /LysR family transcriptional regulator [Novosphingobium sp. PhB165]
MIDPMRLNLRHLDALAVAARLGSISGASKELHLSQPAVTQAVASLESQLGYVLLDRQPSGVQPTEAGRRMTARIERALSYLERGGRVLRRSARLPVLPNIERRITLGQLRTLMAVDEAGSFALASERAQLSQPALHRSARELEEHLGVPLLERQGRTVVSTPTAARFLRFVRLVRAELEAGIDELSALHSQGGGRVRIGTMPVAKAVLLPQSLARFAHIYADAQVSVVEGPYPELLNSLRHGELDILVGALRDPLPVADVTQEGLFSDDPVIVARSGHPLAGRKFEFEMLLEFPWVISAGGTPGRKRWEEMFTSRGLAPPKLRIECGSLLVIRGLMLEGDWLTLLSPDQFLFEARAGLLTRIFGGGLTLQRRIGITTRTDWQPTKLQAAFVETFRQVCDAWETGKTGEAEPFRFG